MTNPVWGCPWHGRVQGGQLMLPNGLSISYPAGIGTSQRSGNTFLMASPSAPPLDRAPEDLSADQAAGMEWRRTATLAGESMALHGRNLGGWLYIDPAGEAWRVTGLNSLQITGNSISRTITLSRFGVLGGSPEVYTYSVSLGDLGQSTPAIDESGSGYLTRKFVELFDVTQDGSAAVFRIALYHEIENIQLGRYQDRGLLADWCGIPIGWLKMQISGPGREAAVSLQVERTREQTLGAWMLDQSGGIGAVYSRSSITGMVIGLWSSGQQLTLDAAGTYTQERESIFLEYDENGRELFTTRILNDSTNQYSIKLGTQALISASSVPVRREFTGVTSAATGGWVGDQPPPFHGNAGDVVIESSDPEDTTRYLVRSLLAWQISLANEPSGNRYIGAATLCNRLICFHTSATTAGTSDRTFGACASPIGALSMPDEIVPGAPYNSGSYGVRQRLYASLCPVTDQAARALSPVCWT